MAHNGGAVRLEQITHLRLCQPHSFFVHLYIQPDFSIFRLIDDNIIQSRIKMGRAY